MNGFRRRTAWAVATASLALLTACGSSSSRTTTRDRLLPLGVPAQVTVGTRRVAGLGTILVDGRGHALYMFSPDARRRVSCTGACAGTWPPLVVSSRSTPTAADGVRSGLLSTLADPNTGARAVTYSGYPLYRYAGDVQAGTADGQALFLDGGPWYVLNAAGDPITTDPGDDR